MFKIISFCGLVAILTLINHIEGEHFDYQHQASWYDDFEECKLNKQSPIELSTHEASYSTDIPELIFKNYERLYPTSTAIENNGHTASISIPKPQMVDAEDSDNIYVKSHPHIAGGPLGQDFYVTEALHFHWGSRDTHGSEHIIDGKRFSMEMHLVHRNKKYASVDIAKGHRDGLVVLAVFFSVDATKSSNYSGLDNILEAISSVSNFNMSSEVVNFSLKQLLTELNTQEFFTYEGSLTTPPCSEAVTWIVFDIPIEITHDQMSPFHNLFDEHAKPMDNNYRGLQPKAGRPVKLYKRRKHVDDVLGSEIFKDFFGKFKPEAGPLPLDSN